MKPVIPERYQKNVDAYSASELQAITSKRVCVVGCGGLGGHAAAILARFGVGALTLCDGDAFSPSNLNRQLFATELTLGQNKATATQTGLRVINSTIALHAYPVMLHPQNATDILSGHDLVLDCLDSIDARRTLDAACQDLLIPYVHAALGGFFGQVANVFPGDDLLARIYPPDAKQGAEVKQGCPSFMPPVIAGLQCREVLALLCGRAGHLCRELLVIDLQNLALERIPLN